MNLEKPGKPGKMVVFQKLRETQGNSGKLRESFEKSCQLRENSENFILKILYEPCIGRCVNTLFVCYIISLGLASLLFCLSD